MKMSRRSLLCGMAILPVAEAVRGLPAISVPAVRGVKIPPPPSMPCTVTVRWNHPAASDIVGYVVRAGRGQAVEVPATENSCTVHLDDARTGLRKPMPVRVSAVFAVGADRW